jgi:hypothetical protein
MSESGTEILSPATGSASSPPPGGGTVRRRGAAFRRSVEVKLRRAWGKERRFVHTRGLCNLIVWIVVMILLDFLVDWLFEMPGAGRLMLLLGNLAVLGWMAYRRWWRYLKPYDAARVALQVEHRHPYLKSILVSYVQLDERAAMDAYVSPALIRALRRQAIEVTDPLDFKKIVNYLELKRIFLFSILFVGVFAAGSVNWPEYFRALAHRMFDPTSNVRYPTRTQIESLTSDLTVRKGDPVALSARATGWVPQRGAVHVRRVGGSAWQKVEVPLAGDREFTRLFGSDEAYESFEYYFRIGDASSQKYTVTVVPPPVVRGTIHLKFPEYTHLRESDIDGLNLEGSILEGTEMQWRLQCDAPVAKADMLIYRERNKVEPLPMKLSPDGLNAELPKPLKAAGTFSYRFRWTREPNYVYEEDVEHIVPVKFDGPPRITLLKPPARSREEVDDLKATIYKTLALSYVADDDYGLSEVCIVYRINGGDAQRAPLEDPNLLVVRKVQKYPWTLKEAIPTLKEGDFLTFHIEVTDTYNGDNGLEHTKRSEERRVSILSLADYRDYILRSLADLIDDVRKAHTSETEADETVTGLREAAPTTTSAPASLPLSRPNEGGAKP